MLLGGQAWHAAEPMEANAVFLALSEIAPYFVHDRPLFD
jgi:hypothetical protein